MIHRIVTLLALLSVVLLYGCTDIEPGSVGLRVHKTGGERGVEHKPYYGRVYEAINVDIVVFPITVQNVIWTKAPHEGSPNDESITFTVAGGITVNADVGMNFRVDPNKAHLMYTRYHQTDLAILADGQIRNDVRDCLADSAAGMPVTDFLGSGRAGLLERTTECVRARQTPFGVIIENIAFVNAPRIPENVQAAINASLEAQQHEVQANAQARAELATAQGHAAAELATAQGHAAAQEATARGEARALAIRTEAEVQAYRSIQPVLTPEVSHYRLVNRWDGHAVPTYGPGTMFSLPAITH
jgi:regulator of protease activity HflC (stomatin/prohibitin superfamily)